MNQHTLYLMSPGSNRQKVMMWLRQILKLSLAETKELTDTSRAKIISGAAFEIIKAMEELEQLGATILVDPPLPKISSWERKPSLEKPREQHYEFTHRILVSFFSEDAQRLWGLLVSTKADKIVQEIWERAGDGTMSVDDTGLRRSHEQLKVGEAVMIKLPEPKAAAEGHLIALVQIPAGKPFFRKSRPGAYRYFVLEQGEDLDGRGHLILCEWTDDWQHINYGEHKIEPDTRSFKDVIDKVVSNRKGPVGISK